ncbi:hypothetical protein ACWDR2_39985 [Streptomyces sp. NPDC003631]|uniref:hypothetical protein n=1 Tax=unclassified Streptomyces TaxID=2593676 RepID=UPI003677F023
MLWSGGWGDRAEQRDLVDARGMFDPLRGHVGGIDHVLPRRARPDAARSSWI